VGSVIGACAVLALLGVIPRRVVGQAHSIDVIDFHADLAVGPNATLQVTERLRVHFSGSWVGLYRQLSLRSADGGQIQVGDVVVKGENGDPLRYELERSGGSLNVKMWIPGARDTTLTVTLRYFVRGAISCYRSRNVTRVTVKKRDPPGRSCPPSCGFFSEER
jgi:Predicted membrane protein (DUF2207) N-terminal domain